MSQPPPKKKIRMDNNDLSSNIEEIICHLKDSFSSLIQSYINSDNFAIHRINSNPLLSTEAPREYFHLRTNSPTADMRLLHLPDNLAKCWSSITSELISRATSPDSTLREQLAILLGVSGSGKTRTLFEALCLEYGLYFDLSTYKAPRHYEFRLDGVSFESRNEAMNYFETVFLARLLVLLAFMSYAKQQDKKLSPKNWLSFQLHSTLDPESQLIDMALHKVDLFFEGNIKQAFRIAKTIFSSYRNEVHPTPSKQDTNLLVCVDEAYMLLHQDRFTTTEGEPRSLLSPLVMTATDLSGLILLTLAGTNTELAKVTKEAESATAKGLSTAQTINLSQSSESDHSLSTPSDTIDSPVLSLLSKPYILTGFQSITGEFIDNLLNQFIRSDILNFKPNNGIPILELTHQIYKGGRARMFMNFLMNIVISHKEKYHKVEFLEPYRNAFREEKEEDLKHLFKILYSTVFHDVFSQKYTSLTSILRRFLGSSLQLQSQGPGDILGFILERYLFFNDLPCYGEYTEDLINHSICFLQREDEGPNIQVTEFLLIQALQKLRKEKKITLPHERILQSSLCTSQVGGKYAEYVFAEKLFEKLSGKPLAEWPELKDFKLPRWCCNARLYPPSFQGKHISDLSEEITSKNNFKCFVFPEDAAGPDFVFYLDDAEKNEQHLAFVQCKIYQTAVSGHNADKCIATTTPEGTYVRGSTQQPQGRTLVNTVNEKFPQGHLGVVIVYPKLSESKKRNTTSFVQGEDVTLVIDQSNFLEFFDDDIYDLVISHAKA